MNESRDTCNANFHVNSVSLQEKAKETALRKKLLLAGSGATFVSCRMGGKCFPRESNT